MMNSRRMFLRISLPSRTMHRRGAAVKRWTKGNLKLMKSSMSLQKTIVPISTIPSRAEVARPAALQTKDLLDRCHFGQDVHDA